jgi:hypothetical protein
MNKKRLVSMLLVSAMTAALFTGCGSDGNLTSGDGTTSAGTNSTTEEAGGFVGCTVGMYASSNGSNSDNYAEFSYIMLTR